MITDKRNTSVVIALIFSMTVGARLLLWLEPGRPQWQGETMLMAERARPISEVEISYAGAGADVTRLFAEDAPESICVIDADGRTTWKARGPRVRLVVVGSASPELGRQQKQNLLWALSDMSRAGGRELIAVRLASDSDAELAPDLPAQAADLRALLVRKRMIP